MLDQKVKESGAENILQFLNGLSSAGMSVRLLQAYLEGNCGTAPSYMLDWLKEVSDHGSLVVDSNDLEASCLSLLSVGHV